MYNELFKIIKKNIAKLQLNNNSSSSIYNNRIAFNLLEKSLDKSCANLITNLRVDILQEMHQICSSVIDEVEDETNLEINKDNLIEDVMSAVILGTIYNTNWKLSSALQKILESNEDLVYDIIEQGMAEGKSAEEIAEEIIRVLDPNSNQEKRSYTKDHKTLYVGRPDYQAHRLARTTLQHTYQTVVVGASKMISEITSRKVMIRWISAMAPNTCQICESRHLNLYSPDDLPLEHPNGQCTFEIEIY